MRSKPRGLHVCAYMRVFVQIHTYTCAHMHIYIVFVCDIMKYRQTEMSSNPRLTTTTEQSGLTIIAGEARKGVNTVFRRILPVSNCKWTTE